MLYTAVELLWVQSQETVEWTWHCSLPADGGTGRRDQPPPLHFWFIPLCLRADQTDLSAELVAMDGGQEDASMRWQFRWHLKAGGRKGLPLKIKVWTPEGVRQHESQNPAEPGGESAGG